MNTEWSDLLYQILSLLVTALAVIVLPAIRKWLLARISAEQLATAMGVARIVVRAVEQTLPLVKGAPKLNAALQNARQYAERLGLKLTDEQWKSLLEQAVLEMNREVAPREPRPPAA